MPSRYTCSPVAIRQIGGWLLILGFLSHLATPAAQAKDGTTDSPKRPNVLLIVVDDQSPLDLKCYNPSSKLHTPTIDSLAKSGVVIEAAHHMGSWVGAVCTASRHMIMTGRTVWHLPRRKKSTPDADTALQTIPADLAEQSLPAVFGQAGYDTMRTCKKGNSFEGANKLFQVRRDATKRGATSESGSQWHGDQVIDYLQQRKQRGDSDPFFIYYGFSHPHDTRNGRPELLLKYGATNHKDKETLPPSHPDQPQLPANYLPAHPFHHGQPGLRDEEKVSGVWKRRDERTIRNEIGRQFACSENIDQQIERVLNQLEEDGELDNTYVIYTSDHGMAIGRHGLQGKQNLYEHTFRVPLIVKGPKIGAGRRATGNVYLLDLLATLCDLSGVEIPVNNEGISFKEVLEGNTDTVRDVLYGVYSGGTKPGMRCVKRGDWKLIKYDVLNGQVHETQLFNLAENPHEWLAEHHEDSVKSLLGIAPTEQQRDLAEDPRYAKQLAEMEALLLDQMRKLHDPYRLWNQPTDGLTQMRSDGRSVLASFHSEKVSNVTSNMTKPVSGETSLRPQWVSPLKSKIDQLQRSSEDLPRQRQELLSEAAEQIARQVNRQKNASLNFICTHNSRRSHLSQLWAAVAAEANRLPMIGCFSGGTEATACNERIVRSLRRSGFSVVTEEPLSDNPRYLAQYSTNVAPLLLFSKRYDAEANPGEGFFAMMCCSDADEKCPVVAGATGRVALHYEDPKCSDGTASESAVYDQRSDEIGAEMFFLMRAVKQLVD